jgi:hypothetical protein
MVKSATIQDVKPASDNTEPEKGTPIIVKHQSANTQINNVKNEFNPNASDPAGVIPVSNTAATINPPSDTAVESENSNSNDDNSNTNQKSSEPDNTQSDSDEDLPKQSSNEAFAAVDALPSKTAQETTEVTNNMSQPKIFDTKEYFVPIHDTTHKHGHMMGTIIAGIVSALVMLALIYFVALGL